MRNFGACQSSLRAGPLLSVSSALHAILPPPALFFLCLAGYPARWAARFFCGPFASLFPTFCFPSRALWSRPPGGLGCSGLAPTVLSVVGAWCPSPFSLLHSFFAPHLSFPCELALYLFASFIALTSRVPRFQPHFCPISCLLCTRCHFYLLRHFPFCAQAPHATLPHSCCLRRRLTPGLPFWVFCGCFFPASFAHSLLPFVYSGPAATLPSLPPSVAPCFFHIVHFALSLCWRPFTLFWAPFFCGSAPVPLGIRTVRPPFCVVARNRILLCNFHLPCVVSAWFRRLGTASHFGFFVLAIFLVVRSSI